MKINFIIKGFGFSIFCVFFLCADELAYNSSSVYVELENNVVNDLCNPLTFSNCCKEYERKKKIHFHMIKIHTYKVFLVNRVGIFKK